MKPTGKRVKPRVARGPKSPSFNTSTGRSYSSKPGSKPPTGSRPMPQVAKSSPRFPGPPSGRSGPIDPGGRMPAPNAAAGRAKGRKNGG